MIWRLSTGAFSIPTCGMRSQFLANPWVNLGVPARVGGIWRNLEAIAGFGPATAAASKSVLR